MLKCYDSVTDGSVSRWSFHTACVDPTAPRDARCRSRGGTRTVATCRLTEPGWSAGPERTRLVGTNWIWARSKDRYASSFGRLLPRLGIRHLHLHRESA